MRNKKSVTILVLLISILGVIAALGGILPKGGSGEYLYESIRGQVVPIYGKGLYHHMSADVAIQGIAQDYVTLFIAIPFMLLALYRSLRGSLKWRFMLAGSLNYIFLTYLFYMNMAMYNQMFLVYITLTGLSFFAFVITLLSFDLQGINDRFNKKAPTKFIGGFLIFNSIIMALLWLEVIVPPLIDGSIVPVEVQHYTTLTVQAFDLALFLPFSFVSGLLLIRNNRYGFLFAPVYLVFLSLLMVALIAKVVAMAMAGVNVVPAIFIISCIAITAISCGTLLIKNINEN